ncbi:MAG: Mut7-C RNAse domain-containing protein [Candidatus Hydrogenedentota bacterium]
MSEIKFIVDAMMGRTARLLRVIGIDTLFYPEIDDARLLAIAKKENRIIITRDTAFLIRKNLPPYYYVKANETKDQFKEIVKYFNIKFQKDNIFTRCIVCNGSIDTINKDRIKDKVPEYTYQTIDIFYKCNGCGKIYWQGSHYSKAIDFIEGLFNESTTRPNHTPSPPPF